MKDEIKIASSGVVDWSVFLQEGVIVTLTIKYYRGTTTVNFAELGIDSNDEKLQNFLGEYITLGTKCLIPPEIKGQLKSIETTARQNLKDHSFDCSAFASSGKFVPKSMYKEFVELNEELKERFYTIRDEFANNYDNIIEHVRKDYKVLAEKLYEQSHPQAKRPSPKYVNAFIDKIVEQIATPEEIVASFEFTTTLSRIPNYILNVISKKSVIDEKVMRIASTNSPADISAAVAATKKNGGDSDNNKKEKTGKTEKQSQAEIDEIERDIQKSILDQSETQAKDFVADIVMKIRNDAIEGADSIIRSIDKNDGKLMGRASVKAHSLVDDLRKMNFYGDDALEYRVQKLELALGDDSESRDVTEVRAAALELRDWAQKSLDKIYSKTIKRKAAAAPAAKKKSSGNNSNSSTSKSKSANSSAKKKNTSSTSTQTKNAHANSSTTNSSAPQKKAKPKIAVPKNTKRRTIKQRS